jgi:hypothetical protein
MLFQKVAQEGKIIILKILHYIRNINMEFTQYGDDQSIKIYGANLFQKNMRVIQSGNGASVIILNKLNHENFCSVH